LDQPAVWPKRFYSGVHLAGAHLDGIFDSRKEAEPLLFHVLALTLWLFNNEQD
jgi:hypothetical protein